MKIRDLSITLLLWQLFINTNEKEQAAKKCSHTDQRGQMLHECFEAYVGIREDLEEVVETQHPHAFIMLNEAIKLKLN